VVIAINPPGEYVDVLDAAARLASRLKGQLEALLFEDTGLLEVARLPFTRAFDSAGRERALDDRALQRAWEAEKRRVDEAMRHSAASFNVRASLRTVQGRFLSEVPSMADTGDVTVLVYSRSLARGLTSSERGWMRARPGARGRPAHTARRPRPVWVYFDESAAAVRALDLAAQLAHDYRCGLLVLHPADQGADAARGRIQQRVGALASSLTCVPVSGALDQVLVSLHRPEGGALLLAPRDALEAESVPKVLDALAGRSCPLVLVA
jgi:hypothetical protein